MAKCTQTERSVCVLNDSVSVREGQRGQLRGRSTRPAAHYDRQHTELLAAYPSKGNAAPYGDNSAATTA